MKFKVVTALALALVMISAIAIPVFAKPSKGTLTAYTGITGTAQYTLSPQVSAEEFTVSNTLLY